MKTLSTLIRLAQLALDEKRKIVVALEQKIAEVEAYKASLIAALDEERKRPPDALEGGLTQGAYIKATYKKCEQCDAQLAELARLMDIAQDQIRLAFEDLKRYEIAAEQRQLAERRDEKKRETKMMDEIGSESQRRKDERS